MSIFQTRSRNNSFAAIGASASQLFHPQPQQQQPQQQQQQQQQYQHQHPGGMSAGNHNYNMHDGNSSLDPQQHQEYSHSSQQHHQAGAGPTTATAARPQLFSDFFRRYELMIEFTNLRNPHHCPSGLYVMPAADNMNQWFGTIFIHKGYYRNGVFKFQLLIPAGYPDRRPTVRFLSDMWHPLIDEDGSLTLQYQFPQWRPHRDYLFHVLHFIKAAFKKCVLDSIHERQAVNKEAFRMYRQENKIFAKLAQQRAQLSLSDSSLYDNYPTNNSIKFAPLSNDEFGELKQKMIGSTSLIGIKPTESSLLDDQLLKERLSLSLKPINSHLAD